MSLPISFSPFERHLRRFVLHFPDSLRSQPELAFSSCAPFALDSALNQRARISSICGGTFLTCRRPGHVGNVPPQSRCCRIMHGHLGKGCDLERLQLRFDPACPVCHQDSSPHLPGTASALMGSERAYGQKPVRSRTGSHGESRACTCPTSTRTDEKTRDQVRFIVSLLLGIASRVERQFMLRARARPRKGQPT